MFKYEYERSIFCMELQTFTIHYVQACCGIAIFFIITFNQ